MLYVEVRILSIGGTADDTLIVLIMNEKKRKRAEVLQEELVDNSRPKRSKA